MVLEQQATGWRERRGGGGGERAGGGHMCGGKGKLLCNYTTQCLVGHLGPETS